MTIKKAIVNKSSCFIVDCPYCGYLHYVEEFDDDCDCLHCGETFNLDYNNDITQMENIIYSYDELKRLWNSKQGIISWNDLGVDEMVEFAQTSHQEGV